MTEDILGRWEIIYSERLRNFESAPYVFFSKSKYAQEKLENGSFKKVLEIDYQPDEDGNLIMKRVDGQKWKISAAFSGSRLIITDASGGYWILNKVEEGAGRFSDRIR